MCGKFLKVVITIDKEYSFISPQSDHIVATCIAMAVTKLLRTNVSVLSNISIKHTNTFFESGMTSVQLTM